MTKPHPKPSDRGRNSPEPGDTPGTRAGQRDTEEQLEAGHRTSDPALAWERDEQEKLPPRGEGSQHNQGADAGPTIESGSPRREETGGEPVVGAHTGGTRGPSNDNRSSRG
jgi:hypothetical protein